MQALSIEFHCPACEKLVRAPEAAGGKHGKCPYCDAKVYIPTPFKDDDLIPLAPMDEGEEGEADRLRKEAIRYATTMDKDVDAQTPPPETPPPRGAGARRAEAPGEVIDVGDLVEKFVLAMRDSKLDDADRTANKLKRAGARARDHVEGLLLDPTPPPYEGVPKPLVQGFLKALLERLG